MFMENTLKQVENVNKKHCDPAICDWACDCCVDIHALQQNLMESEKFTVI
jgi:hypothetical protein